MQLDDFELVQETGDGAWRAVQRSLGRPVLVRLLPAGCLDRLRRIAALSHPNLLPVYGAGEAEGQCYLALRWVDGPTLEELLAGGLLPAGPALQWLAESAGALAAAHAAGLAHGALDASQVRVADGRALLCGVGLAACTGRSSNAAEDLVALHALLPRVAAGALELPWLRALLDQPPRDAAALAGTLRQCLARPELAGQSLSLDRALGAPSITMRVNPPAAAPRGAVETLDRPFGKFHLRALLGRGGMGLVYRAHQTDLDREVALKMLSAPDEGPDAGERFLREARAAARLRHPNIVPVHEVGQVDGQPYFTMELVEGRSLKELIDGGGLPLREGLALLVAVARGVEHAHEQGVIHRDLKPSNILVDARGRPQVTDFGLAKSISAGATEQTRSGDVFGPRSDVYGLGAVLYHLVAGRPPFQAESPMHSMLAVIAREPDPPRMHNPRLHADVETICLKALEQKPEKRYPSAAALADDLQRFLDGSAILARPVGWIERGWRRLRRRWFVAACVAAVLLTGAGLTIDRLRQSAARRRERIDRLRPQAAAAFEQGRFAQAGRLYRELLALAPADAEAARRAPDCERRAARIERLRAELKQADRSTKLALLTELVTLAPRDAAAWAERGLVKLASDKHPVSDALRDLEQALLLRGDEPTAHYGKATYYLDIRKDLAQAVHHYQEAARDSPPARRYECLIVAANLLIETHYHQRALDLLDPLAREFPDKPQIPLYQAVCHGQAGRIDQALAACDRALAIDPQNQRARLRKLKLLRLHRSLQEALALSREICLQHPRSTEAWIELGRTYERMGRFDEALQAFDRSVENHAGDPAGFAARARFLLDRRQFDAARATLEQVLARHPRNAAALALRGKLNFEQGRYAESERDTRRALALDPTNATVALTLTRLFERSGLLHSAIDMLAQLRRHSPDRLPVRFKRAELLARVGRHPEAEQEYREATRIDRTGLAHFALGQYLEQRKRWAEAEQALTRSITLGFVRGYLTRGNVRVAQQRLREALADYAKTLELDRDPRRRQAARANAQRVREALRKPR